MCGRYAYVQDLDRWRDVFKIMQPIEDRTNPAAEPRYNIAPSNPNRVNVLYPPDLVNQLRIFAVLNQFRLNY